MRGLRSTMKTDNCTNSKHPITKDIMLKLVELKPVRKDMYSQNFNFGIKFKCWDETKSDNKILTFFHFFKFISR